MKTKLKQEMPKLERMAIEIAEEKRERKWNDEIMAVIQEFL